MDNQVVIRTIFGELSDQDGYFNSHILTLLHNPAWRAWALESDSLYMGPFCYTPWERDLPF